MFCHKKNSVHNYAYEIDRWFCPWPQTLSYIYSIDRMFDHHALLLYRDFFSFLLFYYEQILRVYEDNLWMQIPCYKPHNEISYHHVLTECV